MEILAAFRVLNHWLDPAYPLTSRFVDDKRFSVDDCIRWLTLIEIANKKD